MLRVISIGTDRNIFDPTSSVAKRAIEYGSLFDELHIIVFAKRTLGLNPLALSPKVWVYPSNSEEKLFYFFDTLRIAKSIFTRTFFGQTVVTAEDILTGIVGVFLKIRYKTPLQIQIHTDIFSNTYLFSGFLNFFRRAIARIILPKADNIRVVKKTVAESISLKFRIPAERITLLPIFVDIKKIQDSPITVNLGMKYSKWEKVVLIASRLEKEKNIKLAIRAFALARKKFPNIGLVILGRGSEEGKLKSEVRRLKIHDSVVFEPWQQDPISYFKTADIFLNTSNFEGYGMALIEAAASLCPIVTTNVGIARDLLEDGRNAFVCPVKNKNCIANKLITLLENPFLLRQVSETLKKDVEELKISKESYLEQYGFAIKSLAAK